MDLIEMCKRNEERKRSKKHVDKSAKVGTREEVERQKDRASCFNDRASLGGS